MKKIPSQEMYESVLPSLVLNLFCYNHKKSHDMVECQNINYLANGVDQVGNEHIMQPYEGYGYFTLHI